MRMSEDFVSLSNILTDVKNGEYFKQDKSEWKVWILSLVSFEIIVFYAWVRFRPKLSFINLSKFF